MSDLTASIRSIRRLARRQRDAAGTLRKRGQFGSARERALQEALEEMHSLVLGEDDNSPAIRINITIREDVLSAIDEHCEESGITRSAFLAEAATDRMDSEEKTP